LLSSQRSEAIADFQLGIGANPGSAMAVYSAIWLHIARTQAGQDDAEDLAPVVAKANLSKWPGPALKLFLGEGTSDEALAAAQDRNPETQKNQLCEANYYLGESALAHQQRTLAKTRFIAARDVCPKDYVEYAGALAELKKLSAAAPAAGRN